MFKRIFWLSVIGSAIVIMFAACSSNEPAPQPVAVPEQVETPAVESVPAVVPVIQQKPSYEEVPKIDTLNIEAVEESVSQFIQNDPYRELFDIDGKLREHWYDGADCNRYKGSCIRWQLEMFAGQYKHLQKLFDAMPLMARRQFLKDAGPIVMNYAVGYVHPSYIENWLTKLDWSRDIASVDPEWYAKTKWPEDQTQMVELGNLGQMTKTDLWVRMFWLRRGEAVFTAAKTAAIAAKTKST